MIRGDICYHTFKPPDKRRPVLVLTRSEVIPDLNAISIAPITSTLRENGATVWLDESDGMKNTCLINLDRITTVPKTALGNVIAHLSEEKMEGVLEAIKFAFGFED